MKRVMIVLALMLTLAMGAQAASQKHRHHPAGTELVDTTKSGSGVTVFSDTTTVDSGYHASNHMDWDDDDWDDDDHIEQSIVRFVDRITNSSMMTGMVISLVAIVIIFLLAPLLIIIAIFYFVNKNRKQRMKLAQMAMEKGQPIPDDLLNNRPEEVSDEYQKGMRQCFVGVGLMVFLGLAAREIGFGIGALVFCIGLGKVFAAKTAQKKSEKNNDLNYNDYD